VPVHNNRLQRTVMDKVPRHEGRRAAAEPRRYAALQQSCQLTPSLASSNTAPCFVNKTRNDIVKHLVTFSLAVLSVGCATLTEDDAYRDLV
jgi:hypothetical protein